jgi:hypothetical protein
MIHPYDLTASGMARSNKELKDKTSISQNCTFLNEKSS